MFYCIWHEKTNTFLTLYEDGEGNEYYCFVEFDRIHYCGIYGDKSSAENALKFAHNYVNHQFFPLSKEKLDESIVCPIYVRLGDIGE